MRPLTRTMACLRPPPHLRASPAVATASNMISPTEPVDPWFLPASRDSTCACSVHTDAIVGGHRSLVSWCLVLELEICHRSTHGGGNSLQTSNLAIVYFLKAKSTLHYAWSKKHRIMLAPFVQGFMTPIFWSMATYSEQDASIMNSWS